MALTIDALKGLYEKLGGEDFGDVTTIPEAIDKVTSVASSGGGDTYETVAEIAVGTMEYLDGYYVFHAENAEIPELNDNDTLYLNTPDNKSTMVYNDSEGCGILFNTDNPDDPSPIIEDKPAYSFYWKADDRFFSIVGTNNSIENTTVRILKKVGGETITVDDALSDTSKNPVQNKVICAALAGKANSASEPFVLTLEYDTATNKFIANKTLDEVVAAAKARKRVLAREFMLATEDESSRLMVVDFDNAQIEEFTLMGETTKKASFVHVDLTDPENPAYQRIYADNSVDGGEWKATG